MSIWSTLFNSSDTISKATDAVINAGDKLFYTEEEKAETKLKLVEHFPTLLKSYEPFKIAQRILAIWFSGIFGISFLICLTFTIYNIAFGTNYDMKPIFDLINNFGIDMIVLAIVSFYFLGGSIESFKKAKEK